MYTQMTIYAFWAVTGLVFALYLFVQLIRLKNNLKILKRKSNQKKIKKIEKKVEKKLAHAEEKKIKKQKKNKRTYESQNFGEESPELKNKMEDEELWYAYPERDYPENMEYDSTNKRETKESKIKLGDRIYKKHSWTQFNCDLDNINHDSLVSQMQRRQDDSYNFLQNVHENNRIQEEEMRFQNELNQF